MLQRIIDWLVFSCLGFNPGSRLGGAINFFLYDSIKILLLLFFMISIVGFIRSYVSQHKIKRWISQKGILGNVLASVFGSITPFCSCSSIPLFLSFVEVGIPLGVTFSFLITSPLINEYLVIIMLGFFGWKITFFYVLSGLAIGTISGIILGKMHLDKYLVRGTSSQDNQDIKVKSYKGLRERISFGIKEAISITRRLWAWVLLGVALGAIIHNYIPEELIHSIIDRTGPFSVPIAALLGVPMYGSCAAIVPIAVVLFRKGVPLGTALAFMMATSALSFPEAVILRRAMKLKLIVIFFSVTTAAIIITGYLFNLLQAAL